jgi:hypothetical protein
MLFCRCALSLPFTPESFLMVTSLGQGVILDRGMFASAKMYFILSSA